MTRVIADESLKARFKGFLEPLEIRDEEGRLLGFFQPGVVNDPEVLAWADSVFTEERLERSRRSTVSYTTEEVLEHLRKL